MYYIQLSGRELTQLKQRQKQEKSVRVQRRLQAIELASQGHTHQEIAASLNVCMDTITDWIKLYAAEKLPGLCTLQFKDKRKSKLDEHIDQIKQDIHDHTISTLAELQDWIKKQYSIELEQSWLWRCCKKNSIYLTKKLV